MLGLTQQQLAEMIGVTYQQAHKYERGINRVSAGRLFEIARALNDQDIQVDIVPKLFELMSPGVTIHTVEGIPLVGLPPFRLLGSSRLLKRTSDVVVSGFGLLVFLPFFALAALAIKLDSRGPVFFRQIRRGQGDKLFWLYKFRTMHPSQQHHSEWVQDNEERVTRVGRWLRRFRADELPQFINILRGEMNLVGPRPHPVSNQKLFVERIAFYSLRSAVLPGLTGWAQVRYRYANTLEEMLVIWANARGHGAAYNYYLRPEPAAPPAR